MTYTHTARLVHFSSDLYLSHQNRIIAVMLKEVVDDIQVIYDLSGIVASLDNILSLAKVSSSHIARTINH